MYLTVHVIMPRLVHAQYVRTYARRQLRYSMRKRFAGLDLDVISRSSTFHRTQTILQMDHTISTKCKNSTVQIITDDKLAEKLETV